MLKTLLEERGISVYRLSKESRIPYSTLNDLVNHKLPIENMRCGQVRALAEKLNMDMDSLYEMCSYTPCVVSQKYGIHADISVKHKCFWLTFQRNGKTYDSEILAACTDAFRYLDIFAEWKLNEILEKLEMEETYEAVLAEALR